MNIFKGALKAVVNLVAPKPQSYLVTQDEDGVQKFVPMGALYTPKDPPPRDFGTNPAPRDFSIK